MNANVAQLLLLLAGGIGGAAALRRHDRFRPRHRPLRLGAHLMRLDN